MDFSVSNLASSHDSVHSEWMTSFCTPPVVVAPPYLPTKIVLTSEGILGDQRLLELGKLGDDWDGYGGAAIASSIVASSREYFATLLAAALPAPDIQPNSNGTISFDWTAATGDAQLEIGNTSLSLYIKQQGADPIFVEAKSSEVMIRNIANLLRSTLFAREQTTTATSASYGRQGGVHY